MTETRNTRTVVDAMGARLSMTVDGNMLTVLPEGAKGEGFMMDQKEAQILKAFVDRALSMPRVPHDDEELEEGRRICLVSDKTPYVRLSGKDGDIDIHPPSWTPLSCEIALLLPRMKDKS